MSATRLICIWFDLPDKDDPRDVEAEAVDAAWEILDAAGAQSLNAFSAPADEHLGIVDGGDQP